MRYDSPVTGDWHAIDDRLSAFERARPRLLGIAYRMLGSVTDAEEVVQDVWTRWQSTDRRVVREPQAFLATTTRLAINVLQSARTRTKRTSPLLNGGLRQETGGEGSLRLRLRVKRRSTCRSAFMDRSTIRRRSPISR